MTRRSIATSVLVFLASACGSAAAPSPQTAATPAKAATKPAAKPAPAAKPDETAGAPAWSRRRPGDFVVHRFSGSFRKIPLTLTEEVVGYDDDLNLIIEYTLEEGKSKTRLRVRTDLITEEVVRVAKLEGDKEIPMGIDAYDALIAETLFTPDTNEGQVAEATETCVIGAQEHSCQTREFKVTVGERDAKLIVSRAEDVPDRDVSGEIRDSAGNVIYRAEIVDMGRAAPSTGVASR
jgi:hypothetical protein